MDDLDCIDSQIVAIDADIEEIETEIQLLHERQRQLKRDRELLVGKKNAAKAAQTLKTSSNFDSNDFSWSEQLDEKLHSVFHIERLRPFQLPTINAILAGQDCILVMPTGGGKSLCFQLPALLSRGTTLVVSPLISLMEDQVMALKALKINAEMLTANTSKAEQTKILDSLTDPKADLKILYVTPERLSKSKRFMSKVEKMYELGLFAILAVDEVHCCSQWGHDFRRDYKYLGVFKRQFPSVPILGLTATATARVTSDVQSMLNIENCIVFRASFNRPNLIYKIHQKPSVQKDVIGELAKIIRSSYAGQSGIIYCFSIKESEEVASELQSRNIKALPYHASLDANYRSKVHKRWINNTCQVVVATVAFGMGIDKPGVRFVIHHSLSKSMENFYQESGRAGRDDKPADCIVFFRFADIFRQSCMVFAEKTGLRNLYAMASYCIEQKRCRRSILADHFGERWQSSDCNNNCDNCNPILALGGSNRKQTELVDISEHCRVLYRILDKADTLKQKLTGLKLVDAWLGKGPTNLRLPGIDPPTYPREECERIIIFLLLENYLEEKFHYTAYATISYIIKGNRSTLLNQSRPIEMEVKKMSSKLSVASVSSGSTKAKVSPTPSTSQTRTKPCVINTANSKFGTHVLNGSTLKFDDALPSQEFTNTNLPNDCNSSEDCTVVSPPKKAKKVVVSLEDEDDIDWGDDDIFNESLIENTSITVSEHSKQVDTPKTVETQYPVVDKLQSEKKPFPAKRTINTKSTEVKKAKKLKQLSQM